jgi:hypothetical protein
VTLPWTEQPPAVDRGHLRGHPRCCPHVARPLARWRSSWPGRSGTSVSSAALLLMRCRAHGATDIGSRQPSDRPDRGVPRAEPAHLSAVTAGPPRCGRPSRRRWRSVGTTRVRSLRRCRHPSSWRCSGSSGCGTRPSNARLIAAGTAGTASSPRRRGLRGGVALPTSSGHRRRLDPHRPHRRPPDGEVDDVRTLGLVLVSAAARTTRSWRPGDAARPGLPAGCTTGGCPATGRAPRRCNEASASLHRHRRGRLQRRTYDRGRHRCGRPAGAELGLPSTSPYQAGGSGSATGQTACLIDADRGRDPVLTDGNRPATG